MADGSVKAIRCNYDGYVAGAGAILGFWYTQPEQVEALLKLGDLSELREKIDTCVAYHRDRGEELSPAVKFDSVEDYQRTGKVKMCADFLYLFEDGQWSAYGLQNINQWVKLNVIINER